MALLTAFDMTSSMVSRGRPIVTDLKGKELPDDPFVKKISNPNYFQSQQDFIYQHQWFKMLGTNAVRVIKIRNKGEASDIDNVKSFNNLIPSCINWKDVNKLDKMIISNSDFKKLLLQEIEYKVGSKEYPIPLSDLVFFYDITNGMQNNSVFKSPSRIKGIEQELRNIQLAQRSKNINLQWAHKHIASNEGMEMNVSKNLGDQEREEVENKIMRKDMIATNAKINIQSLAPDFRKLQYDQGISADCTRVSMTFGINRDALNWYLEGASTYENRENGILDWLQNTIQQQADDWGNTWTNHFGYMEQGKKIGLDFSHLPIMRLVEKMARQSRKEQADIVKILTDAGATLESAAEFAEIENLVSNGESGQGSLKKVV